MIDKKFGRLAVLSRYGTDSRRRMLWNCQCDCGEIKIVAGTDLRRGCVTSCGCSRKTHGQSYTSTYRSWQEMIQRCTNYNAISYPRYGGRGIKVEPCLCKFENFMEYMGEKPVGKTLDRWPNNNGDYRRGNLRWATPREQANHRRSNRVVTYRNRTLTIAEWSRNIGIAAPTIRERLNRGWSIEEALTVLC